MTDVVNDDEVRLGLQYSTQWDGLSHYGGHFDADGDGVAEQVFYNGYRMDTHFVLPDEGQPPAALALGMRSWPKAACKVAESWSTCAAPVKGRWRRRI
jgi:hypothetical protein